MRTEEERAKGQSIFKRRWKETNADRSNNHRERHFKALAKTLASIQTGILVEIGSGSGYAAKGIASLKPGCCVIGIDSTEEAIALAQQGASTNVEFLKGDAFDLPFSAETIAASWTEGLIEHYPQSWRGIIDEQNRITEPGGLIITSVPNILNLPRTLATTIQGSRFRYYPADGFLPGKVGSLYKKYKELDLDVEGLYGWGITYPAQQMYEWDNKNEKRLYPPYTKVFHFLGNLMEKPSEKVDQMLHGKLSKWIGFEFMMVGRKSIK